MRTSMAPTRVPVMLAAIVLAMTCSVASAQEVTRIPVELGRSVTLKAAIAQDAPAAAPQKPDSLLNGILIGAAIGAVPGIYYLIADPNECTGLCPEEYALIAAGAVVGGLIDRAITRKPAAGSRAVRIAPVLTRQRKGVQLAVRF